MTPPNRAPSSSPSRELTDRDILEELKHGRLDFFRILVDRYLSFCQNFFRKHCLGNEEAKDLSQEVFLRLFRAIPGMAPDSNIKGWIAKVSYHLFLDFCRNNARRNRRDLNFSVPESVPGFEDDIAKRDLLSSALQEISGIQGEVVLLKYYADLSCKEISQILDLPEGTVKSHLFLARKKMMEYLQKVNTLAI